jgi:hypothetical protein
MPFLWMDQETKNTDSYTTYHFIKIYNYIYNPTSQLQSKFKMIETQISQNHNSLNQLLLNSCMYPKFYLNQAVGSMPQSDNPTNITDEFQNPNQIKSNK